LLVVDDDDDLRQFLVDGLRAAGLQVVGAATGEQAWSAIEREAFDVALVDLNLPGLDGIELCTRVAGLDDGPTTILMTAFGTVSSAVQGVKAGATDFLVKPLDLGAVLHRIERVRAERLVRAETRRLRAEVDRARGFGDLVGTSPAMVRVYDLLARSARSDASVLLTGETGTGKELAARALHRASRRSDGPFIAVNCSAIPEPLIESELFGHAKGAFTDAATARQGLFVRARGGTLFLDEIGELPMPMQAKLLRVLAERSVRPVGADEVQPVDVRLVTATNRDLEERCEQGEFREDLFFRINVIGVHLPPLRSRATDVLELAHAFVREFSPAGERTRELAADAIEMLVGYTWPGNVRELRNCIERAVALSESESIQARDLPERIRGFARSHVVVVGDDPEELPSLHEVERRYILRVLQAVEGGRGAAAKILGIDRKTLYRKLERYNLDDRSDR